MARKFKKVVAIFLTLTMILSMTSLPTFAEEGSEPQLICGLEESEGHTHGEGCYETTLTCTQEEHTHSASCYELPDGSLEAEPICEKSEHTHTDECYTTTLVCGLEESEGHQHSAECYAAPEPEVTEPETTAPETTESKDKAPEVTKPETKEPAEQPQGDSGIMPIATGITILPDNYPSEYYEGKTNNSGESITKNVGETGFYLRCPTNKIVGEHCGHSFGVYAPMDYIGINVAYSNPGVIGNESYTTGYWNGNEINSECLQMNFDALKPGTTTVTLTYYVNFGINGQWAHCPACGRNTYVQADQWYQYTDIFTVTVKGSSEPDGGTVYGVRQYLYKKESGEYTLKGTFTDQNLFISGTVGESIDGATALEKSEKGNTKDKDGVTYTYRDSRPENITLEAMTKDDLYQTGAGQANASQKNIIVLNYYYDEPETTTYTVTYTDGVDDEVVFDDQSYEVEEGAATPAFQSNGAKGAEPTREGYNFEGWAPTVAETVTEDATYEATWSKVEEEKITVVFNDGEAGGRAFAEQTYTTKKRDDGDYTNLFNTSAYAHAPQLDENGNPCWSGYIFKGWQRSEDSDGNVTYTATWEKDVPKGPTPSLGVLRHYITNVSVECVTENGKHNIMNFQILEGSYTVSGPQGHNGAGDWYSVTINPEKYVHEYSETNGIHTIGEDSPEQIFWFKHSAGGSGNNEWLLNGSSLQTITATFQVEHKTKPESIITEFTKERLTTVPDGISISGINYDATPEIPVNGNITLLYRITVKGTPGTSYDVDDDGATRVGGDSMNGTIPNSGNAVIYVTRTFTQDDITESGTVNNTASVTPGTGDNSNSSATAQTSVTKGVEPMAPSVTKELNDAGKTYMPGDTVTWTITITNPNAGEMIVNVKDMIDGVILSGESYDILTGHVTVPAEGSVSLIASYTVTASDVLMNSLYNTVTATDTKTGKTGSATCADAPKLAARNPELEVTKTVISSPANSMAYAAGETITYQVTVKNTGNVDLTGITVEDNFSGRGKLSWQDADPTEEAFDLKVDENKTFKAAYKVLEADLGTPLSNTATAKCKDGDTDVESKPSREGGNSTTVQTETRNQDLTVTKTINDKKNFYQPGDEITYTITVTNTGNVTINNVTVNDPLTEFNATIDSLTPGASETFITTYTVKSTDNVGNLTNTATAIGSDGETPVTASGSVAATVGPKAPTTLSGTVLVKCINPVTQDRHTTGQYSLDESEDITFSPVVKDENGIYTVTAVVKADSYVDKYNTVYSDHTVVSGQKTKTISLKYQENGWTIDVGTITFEVICNVTEHTVTYTDGVEDETVFEDQVFTVLSDDGNQNPAFNSGTAKAPLDQNNNPARSGYVFDKWNTTEDENGNIFHKALWDEDKLGGTDPDTGDGIADKYQATIEYAAMEGGTVSSAREIVTIKDESGNPAVSGSADITGSTATANAGYYFTRWVNNNSVTFTGNLNTPDLNGTISTLQGGGTYTFTANFARIGELRIGVDDVTVIYDGQPHVGASEAKILGDTGLTLESYSGYTPAASRTDVGQEAVGSWENADAVIRDANGVDVTAQYAIEFIPGKLTITPAPVTVTANDATKYQGDNDPTFTAVVTGMVNDESADELIDYTISRTDAGNETVGAHNTITPTGDVAQGNYTVTYITGTLTILQRSNPTPSTPTVTYYTVTVNYQDTAGTALQSPTSTSYSYGSSYTVNVPTISGYTYDHANGNLTGTVLGNVTVTLVYNTSIDNPDTPLGTVHTLTVNYVDENGDTIRSSDEEAYTEGADYEVKIPSIDGYTYDHADGSLNGKITEDTVVTLNYKKTTDIEDTDTPKSDTPGGSNGSSGSSNNGSGSSSSTRTVTIYDTTTPRASAASSNETIEDSSVPLGDAPSTGDESPLVLWTVLLLGSLLTISAIYTRRRGQRR